jgi:hypothetical protein
MTNHLQKTLLTSLVTLISPLAFAGPPFITDDPEPVEANHWEINYAVSKTWRAGGSSAGAPSIDINYGLSPNIQLHAQPKYAYETDGQDKYSIPKSALSIDLSVNKMQIQTGW